MSIRFLADNDLKRIIVDATLRHEPRIDFQTAQAARLNDLDDEGILRLAASQSRILVSHDKRTMPRALASFIASGGTSPGCATLKNRTTLAELGVLPNQAPLLMGHSKGGDVSCGYRDGGAQAATSDRFNVEA